jgi:acetolactate synthase-1/2/3 large subunit
VIEEDELNQQKDKHDDVDCNATINRDSLISVLTEVLSSKRPLIVAGHGIRISGSEELFNTFINKLGIPIVTTFNGFDLLPDEHPQYVGRIGTIGQRAGNFALQNADCILFLGTRNNIRQVSYNWDSFAKRAKKIVVDIDPAELQKPTVKPDIAINADVGVFLKQCINEIKDPAKKEWSEWLAWCKVRSKRYPVVLPKYKKNHEINPYYFIQSLTELIDEGAVTVCGNGSACVCMFQAGIVKKGQRVFWNSGCASMGYDLPASIGACFAMQRKPVICITGEGSLMMNLQELQTVKHYNLPVKIFVLNNGGYQSIKQTQKAFFGLPFIGCDCDSGVSFPDFMKIANGFDIQGIKIKNVDELKEKIKRVFSINGPVLCEVALSKEYTFSPKLSSKRHPDGTITSPSLEDMFPFLPPEELEKNIIN